MRVIPHAQPKPHIQNESGNKLYRRNRNGTDARLSYQRRSPGKLCSEAFQRYSQNDSQREHRPANRFWPNINARNYSDSGQALSAERAKAVAKYFIACGIDPNRLIILKSAQAENEAER